MPDDACIVGVVGVRSDWVFKPWEFGGDRRTLVVLSRCFHGSISIVDAGGKWKGVWVSCDRRSRRCLDAFRELRIPPCLQSRANAVHYRNLLSRLALQNVPKRYISHDFPSVVRLMLEFEEPRAIAPTRGSNSILPSNANSPITVYLPWGSIHWILGTKRSPKSLHFRVSQS